METTQLEFNLGRVDELLETRLMKDISGTYSGVDFSAEVASGRSRFSNTHIVMERLQHHPEFRAPVATDCDAPYGRFRGRHIIGTGTRVLGGVYLGHKPREAIFVDPSGAHLNACVDWFVDVRFSRMRQRDLCGEVCLERTREAFIREFVRGLPVDLYEFTKERICYSEAATAAVSREAKTCPDEELSLEAYIKAGVGVCRQMVLFLVAMFEKLEERQLTNGQMSVCRCLIPNMFSHAWIRFQEEGTDPIILDPAQSYRGTAEQGGDMGKYVYNLEFARILDSP